MALSPTDLHRLRLQQLAVYVRDSRAHLEPARDNPRDETEEPPIASSAAHAATWRAFRKISYSTGQLVTVAEIQATRLPADVLPASWADVCAGLRDAARCLEELQAQWLVDREEILARDSDTRAEYEAVLQRRNHAAWPYLSLWARSAETILQLDVLARGLTAPVARVPGLPQLPRRRAAPPNRP